MKMQNEHVLLNKLLVIEIEILIERTTGQPNHFQASLKCIWHEIVYPLVGKIF